MIVIVAAMIDVIVDLFLRNTVNVLPEQLRSLLLVNVILEQVGLLMLVYERFDHNIPPYQYERLHLQ